ncbi:uncharacterized protein [Magallana gigas]|uniref:uncharacterized protein isoform X1 n=1 Tax=Magallana gigas TaxID=29159 RepID=UPI003342CA3F
MASTPKRRRRNKAASHPPTETQPQSDLTSHEDRDTIIRTCMASIIPTIEDTFRRYMDEYHHGESNPSSSIPMQTATSQQQSADTQQASSQAVTPDHSLLQEITSQVQSIQINLQIILCITCYNVFGYRFRWHPHQNAGGGTKQPRILPQKPNLKAVLRLMRTGTQ